MNQAHGKGNSGGMALVGLIAAILLMSLFATAIMMISSSGLMEEVENQDWNEAFLAAESGVSAARAFVVTNDYWYTSVPYAVTGVVGVASFSAVINTSAPSMAIITSTGVSGNSRWTSKWSGTSEVSRALCMYQAVGRSNPLYRIYSEKNRVLFSEQAALSVNGTSQWVRVAVNPKTNMYLLVAQNSSRGIWAQIYTNDGWFASTQLNASTQLVAVASNRCFDVAFEQASGRGLAVYGIGTNRPAFRLWYTNYWGTQSYVNVGAAANASIRWLRLVSRPLTDDMMLLARYAIGAANYSMAIRWDGSVWTNLASLETNCASLINFETMDVAYSTSRATVVYVNGTTAAARQVLKYKEFTNSLARWSAEKSISAVAVGGEPQWMRIEFNAQGTNAYFACEHVTRLLKGSFWNGTTWSAYSNFTAATPLHSFTNRAFDVAWSSQTNSYMVVFCRQNTTNHSYVFQRVGAAVAPPAVMAAGTAPGCWSVLRADPKLNEFIYSSIDASNDVCIQRWKTNSWVLLGEVETNSSPNYNSIDIGFRRDLP